MDVLGDLVARERRSDAPAIRVGDDRAVSYRDCSATAAKAGNFLRYRGVDRGDTVAVAPTPDRQPLLTFLGAALLGAAVRFEVPPSPDDPDAFPARAVVAPTDAVAGRDASPGTTLIAYGDPPDRPDLDYWERAVWSENPAFPETPVAPRDPAVTTATATHSHEAVLAAAERTVGEHSIGPDATVVLRGSLGEPGVVAAGVVAPLSIGATVAVPGPETVGDLAVVGSDAPGSVPEPAVVMAASVLG